MRRRSVTTRPLLLTAAATALVWALFPALASAQAGTVPEVTVDPTIAGTPREGQTLTTTAKWTGDPTPTATWRWLRCSVAGDACSPIAGATSDRYPVATADIGFALRARLTVTNSVGSDVHQSRPTAVVLGVPTVPKPSPTPAPTPGPAPTPSVTPAPVRPSGSPGAGSQSSFLPSLLDPFPVVRIRGSLTPTGARITLFTVRAPRYVLVRLRCRGASCPVHRLARRSSTRALTRLRRFERQLRAGTRLEIKLTQRGRIGKWTTIVIRRGAPPKRSDQCAYPQLRVPAPCPSG